MAQTANKRDTRGDLEWIVFSYRDVRRWLLIILVAGAAGTWGVYVYRRNHVSPELRAQRQIDQADKTYRLAEASPDASRFTATLGQAKERLADARSALENAKNVEAYDLAVESESLSRRALGRAGHSDIGDATFVALDGEVQIQRAGRGTWEECRLRQALYDGDFIKTSSSGSAEIMFFDGTLYQLHPDSLFEVKSGQRPDREKSSAVDMVSGSIQVYTSNAPSQIRTKAVSAEVQRDSEVGVSVDEKRDTEISSYRGQAVLRTEKDSVVLSDRERVRADASSQRLGGKIALPESPAPVDPADNRIFDLKKNADVVLRWTAVKEAIRYRLQVSRSRLFIPDATPLDLSDRRGLSAAIRPHEEGSYYWRVSAITGRGVSSDWSPYRRFRVVADAAKAGAPAGTPPPLQLETPQQMGNLFLIFGHTDPSASVSIGGKRADVEPDGSFKTTVTVDQEGESQIVVKAADAAGRETVKRIRVYVELF
ncbi:MAG TPA: FecR domain-containing protein [Thermoanaerobaculia bacterium]|nr:FecR domain-containing protein [Thermoanaerobaculia bacterium]